MVMPLSRSAAPPPAARAVRHLEGLVSTGRSASPRRCNVAPASCSFTQTGRTAPPPPDASAVDGDCPSSGGAAAGAGLAGGAAAAAWAAAAAGEQRLWGGARRHSVRCPPPVTAAECRRSVVACGAVAPSAAAEPIETIRAAASARSLSSGPSPAAAFLGCCVGASVLHGACERPSTRRAVGAAPSPASNEAPNEAAAMSRRGYRCSRRHLLRFSSVSPGLTPLPFPLLRLRSVGVGGRAARRRRQRTRHVLMRECGGGCPSSAACSRQIAAR